MAGINSQIWKNVKKYISNHAKLPSTVKIGDISLKTADYLYLASKAIVNIKAGNIKDLPIKILNDPTNAKAATDLRYLKNYLSVAKSVVNKLNVPSNILSIFSGVLLVLIGISRNNVLQAK